MRYTRSASVGTVKVSTSFLGLGVRLDCVSYPGITDQCSQCAAWEIQKAGARYIQCLQAVEKFEQAKLKPKAFKDLRALCQVPPHLSAHNAVKVPIVAVSSNKEA